MLVWLKMADRRLVHSSYHVPSFLSCHHSLWLLSVLLTLFVLLPMPYGVEVDSASSIERALRRIVRVKYSLLIAAMLLFVVALGMLAGLYVYGVSRS